nr:hypothetical protein SHINE37_100218 [Rhizobiaceae bacterium]
MCGHKRSRVFHNMLNQGLALFGGAFKIATKRQSYEGTSHTAAKANDTVTAFSEKPTKRWSHRA